MSTKSMMGHRTCMRFVNAAGRIPAAVGIGFAGFILTLIVAHGRSTPYNNYVLFADSLLHLHLWIDWPGPYIDAVLFDGLRYIVNDPVPSILLLPFVAIFGLHTNQTVLACVLAGVATGAAFSLFRRLGVSFDTALWLTAFALAGTDLLWCSMLGDVWFVAQSSAVAFTLLALNELAGKRRGWLVAFWFALAVGSRFTVVMALPVIAYWIAFGFTVPERRWAALRSATLTLVPFGALWVAYNLARWHVPWDSGHTIFYHEDAIGSLNGSPFSLGNLPMQFYSFFVQQPTFGAVYPYVVPGQGGVALTWTSPALIIAFFARRPRMLIVSCWVAIVLVAAPSFMYYVNGFAQFGMRHALDFEPFVFVLMALAVRERMPFLAKAAIVWSVAVGMWGTWFWNVFYRH
jgi:hypothetical protein